MKFFIGKRDQLKGVEVKKEVLTDVYRTKGTTAQGIRKIDGEEFVIVTTDNPRQYIEVPLKSILAAKEDLYLRTLEGTKSSKNLSVG